MQSTHSTPRPRASSSEIAKLKREELQILIDEAEAGDVYALETLRRRFKPARKQRPRHVPRTTAAKPRPRAPRRARRQADDGSGDSDGGPHARYTASAWDDRRWFDENRSRSHRLRRAFPGELLEVLPGSLPAAPFGYQWEILVRLTWPNLRERFPFCRNLLAEIPDDEAWLRALYDVVAEGGEGSVPDKQVAELARQYAKRRAMS